MIGSEFEEMSRITKEQWAAVVVRKRNTDKMVFFNTTNETGPTLKTYTERAKAQETDVLYVIKTLKNLELLTPYSVHKVLQNMYKEYRKVPVDSIKRAFTVLKYRRKIEMNGKRTMGDRGRMVKCWKLIKTEQI